MQLLMQKTVTRETTCKGLSFRHLVSVKILCIAFASGIVSRSGLESCAIVSLSTMI